MQNYQLNTMTTFFIRNDLKKRKSTMGNFINMSEKKDKFRESRLFKNKLFKNDYDNNQGNCTKRLSTCAFTSQSTEKKGIKYKVLQSNLKLKYLNDNAIDSFVLSETNIKRRNEDKNICLSQNFLPKVRKNRMSTPLEIEKRDLLKKFDKLLVANVNKSKLYSLLGQNNISSDPLDNYNQSDPKSSDKNQSYRASVFKKSSKVDHLLMRMAMPQECFEEHLLDKDINPKDKYTKFKRLLIKKRENVLNCLEELKKTQTLNDTLIKVYTAKLLSKKYK